MAMALRSEDLQAGITSFELVGEIRAGIEEHIEIQAGQTVRIFTGGKLPNWSRYCGSTGNYHA